MNSGNIKIKNMEMLHVTKCEYEININQYGKAVVEGYIDEADYDTCKRTVYSGEWFAIEEVTESDTAIVFSGNVKSVAFYRDRGYQVKLILHGELANMDMAARTRIFQNGVNSLENMMSKVCEGYQAQYIIGNKHASAISHMVVQYEETDWEFLRRLVIEVGGCLIPEYKYSGCRFRTGVFEGGSISITTEEYAINSLYHEYEKKRENGMNVYLNDQLEYVIKSRMHLNLGDAVNLNGIPLNVYRVEGKWEGQELVHDYTLRSEGAFNQPIKTNYKLIGATFMAKVSKVKHDKVEVTFDSVEAHGTREYDYATVYSSANGAGWYCMPEKDDAVTITFATEEPDSAYASSAVHLSMGSKNPDTKFIRNPYNKEIRFTKDELTITNNQGTEIILNDTNGLTFKSAGEINITAENDITITSATDKITLQAEKGVELIQANSKIEVNGNIKLIGDQVHIQNVE